MNLKRFLTISTTAALFGTTALALPDAQVQGIVDDLAAQGYGYIEISINPDGSASLEATGDTGHIEQSFDADGTMTSQEVTTSDGTRSSADDSDESDDDSSDNSDSGGDSDSDGGDGGNGDGGNGDDGDGDGDGGWG